MRVEVLGSHSELPRELVVATDYISASVYIYSVLKSVSFASNSLLRMVCK